MHTTRSPRFPSSSARTVAALLALLALSSIASAQLKKEKKKPEATPPASTPAQPGTPGNSTPAPLEPIGDKVLKRESMKDWTFRLSIPIKSGPIRQVVDKTLLKTATEMKFESLAIVFPLVETSSSHRLRPFDDGMMIQGEFIFGDKVVDDTPTIAKGYQSGSKLARWEARDVIGKDAELKVNLGFDCFETKYDDKLAETIPWPTNYPPVAASALKPQMFVEFMKESDPPDNTAEEWLKKATAGKDPKALPPARLAKYLAGELMEQLQPSGDGLVFNDNAIAGTLMGFDLRGAMLTIREGRGSEFDLTCALAAVYKAAGIPARTVIGYDVYDQKSSDKALNSKAGKGKFHSWVEFCLIDPANRAEIWVPVDLARMRKASSRAKPLDVSWKYFGSDDELSYILPLAFHFHPPTTVINQVPALWAWLTNPESKPYSNTFQFTVFRMAKRGDDPKQAPPGR